MKIKTESIKSALVELASLGKNGDARRLHVESPTGSVPLSEIASFEKNSDGTVTVVLTHMHEILGKFSPKAKRWYWKKVPASIEVPLKATETEKDEATETEKDEEREAPVICKDRSRYEPYARGDRVSQDCADFVALTLRPIEDVDNLMARGVAFLKRINAKLPRKSTAKNWIEHVTKWNNLNPGHRRMLLGQALRTAERYAEEEETVSEFRKGLKAAFAAK